MISLLQKSLQVALSAKHKDTAAMHCKIITAYFAAKHKDLLVWQTLVKEYLKDEKNSGVKKMLLDEFESLTGTPVQTIKDALIRPFGRVRYH